MSASQELYREAVAVGGELGTSTSKFCADDQVIVFSSVVGDALTPTLEENWRRMNRSRDRRWIRNLAIYDSLILDNGADNYAFSKMAINAYVADAAFPLLKQGIRINAILPGPTDTPLARANADTWLTFGADYREAAGIETLVPEQMGNVMAFLGSDAASGVNGVTLLVDAGHVSSGITGSFENPVVKMLLGLS